MELKDFPGNYSERTLQILDALSMTNLKGMNLLGSATLRAIQYAGDVDALEHVKVSSSSEVMSRLQDIVKKVRSIPGVFFSDIKCGEIPEWNVFRPNAHVKNDIVENFNITESQSRVDSLRRENILTQSEAENAHTLLRKATTPTAFLEARKTLRFHILRWLPSEILEGAKVARDHVVKLEDAIESGGMIKIDVIASIFNRFVEISVVYDVLGMTAPLPPVEQGLREDIVYYSETQPFKALKRTFSLARFYRDSHSLHTLLPILNGDLGRLNQIVGDMDTLISLLSLPRPPLRTIRMVIDEFRSRLGNIYALQDILRTETSTLGSLYAILKTTSIPKLKQRLEKLSATLRVILNKNTRKEVKRLSKNV